MYAIIDTRDGHIIDTARGAQELENKTWWRNPAHIATGRI